MCSGIEQNRGKVGVALALLLLSGGQSMDAPVPAMAVAAEAGLGVVKRAAYCGQARPTWHNAIR